MDRSRQDQVAPYRRFEGTLWAAEQRLFADAVDGRWREHSLLRAALVASGVDRPERLEFYETRLAGLVAELKRSGIVTGPAQQQARQIFEFMHRRILRAGYRLDATGLAEALDHGRFNCVSASVLFQCLAERCGVSVCGLEGPGHAMSRLRLAAGNFDIETTCPEWFRLSGDPAKQAEQVRKTLGSTSAGQRRPGAFREVSDVQLVATIYYNRGVDLLGQRRFAESLAANAKALRLDPSNLTARGNLLATLNNWAIFLGTNGQYAEAAGLLEQGFGLDPAYSTFRANYLHVHRQWVESLSKAERFREALEVLAGAARARPEEAYFAGARQDVYCRWARSQFQAGRVEEAFVVLAEGRGAPGGCAQWPQAEAAEVNRYAVGLLDGGRMAEAVAVLDRGLGLQPESSLLTENRRIAVMRWADWAAGGKSRQADLTPRQP